MALLPTANSFEFGPAVPTERLETALHSEAAIARIESLVAAAAHSLHTDGAVFVLCSAERTHVASFATGAAFDLDAAEALTRAALSEQLLILNRVEGDDLTSHTILDANAAFFASVRVGSEASPAGYLAVHARDARSLSGAQEYLLLMFAAEIGDQLEPGALRPGAREAQPNASANDRRRQLLESVVHDAKDAVLITEAEPARKSADNTASRALLNEAASAQLEYRIFHDELTGLRNRAYLNDRVKTLLKRILDDSGQRFAVMFFDIDRFKAINDSLGHEAGDKMLVEFARRIEGCIRSRDTLARFGGDEFTCLIEAEDLADVVGVAERILAALRTPLRLAGRAILASTSIGIAYVDANYGSSAEIFRDADTAMYRAKSNGGSRYELFNESMHAQALAALRAQLDLSRAIERDEFRLYYQPLVHLDDGHAYGLEALVRWQHPERGLVPPMEFIPIAEETGLIVGIGSWVLHEACRRMRLWHDAAPGREKLTLSVNVSSRQLFDPGFFFELEHALEQSGLDPRTLLLEITESIFLEHAQDVSALLDRIKELGVRIALDDFGTGYSSLSYLERFRFDTLKIDKSFVARLHGTRATAEIVRLIIGLAGALDMEVVAEGIESVAQWEALRELGCIRAQGYYFSRPVPEAEVSALLARPLATRGAAT